MMCESEIVYTSMVTLGEAAKLVGKSRAAVHLWIAKGKLKQCNVGRPARYKMEDVLRVNESQVNGRPIGSLGKKHAR